MTIAQALKRTWETEKLKETPSNKIAPLIHYLKWQYDERYVPLCLRCGIKPTSFRKWLCRSIDTI